MYFLISSLSCIVNCRPVCLLPGVTPSINTAKTTKDLDWVIVRENSEGEYSGQGGRSHVGTPGDTATEVGIFTRCRCCLLSLLLLFMLYPVFDTHASCGPNFRSAHIAQMVAKESFDGLFNSLTHDLENS